MTPLLQSIEQLGIFTAIRDSAYAYPALLWLHIVALIAWGGLMLVTDWHALSSSSAAPAQDPGPNPDLSIDNPSTAPLLRWPKRISFALAALTGLLLFGAKAGLYAGNSWFWVKMLLLVLLAANYLLFRRSPQPAKAHLAAGLSLLLWMGAVLIARGPATVKDVMHTMVDPTADVLFGSMQQVSDEKGTRQEGPQTDEQWADLQSRAQILLDAAEWLKRPDRRGARARDRSANPGIENGPEEVQRLLDADPSDFARRAEKLHQAALVIKKATDAKDSDALWNSLGGIDAACEVCHLRYWYPNDKRAVQAAKEAGIYE